MKRAAYAITFLFALGAVTFAFADRFTWKKAQRHNARIESDFGKKGIVLVLKDHPSVHVIQDSLNEEDLSKISQIKNAKALAVELIVGCKLGLVDFIGIGKIFADEVEINRFFAPQLCLEGSSCGKMGSLRPARYGWNSFPSFFECFK